MLAENQVYILNNFIISVDGPAGSGKERISKYIAKKYKLYHLDSGILYRRLAYELKKKNIETNEVNKIKKFLKNIKPLSLRKNHALRKEQIGKGASEIAKLDFVRYFINSQQRLATKIPNKKSHKKHKKTLFKKNSSSQKRADR